MTSQLHQTATGLLSAGAAAADLGDAIEFSGLFDAASGDYISQTFGTPTSTAVFMLSFWYRRAKLGASTTVMGTDTGSGDRHLSRFQTGNLLDLTIASTSNTGTTKVYRDPNAWGHAVISYDGGQATVADRLQIFDNGVEVAWTNISGTLPTVSDKLNTAVAHAIGRFQAIQPFDGYLAEINFTDGTSITNGDYAITDLGRFSTTHPTDWVPITAPSLTYGANGFRLDFADSGDLGKDVSGQANHWTNSGVTQSTDTPTTVYPTLSPLAASSESSQGISALSNGNTSVVAQTNRYARSQWVIDDNHQGIYYEIDMDTVDAVNNYPRFGIALTSYSGTDLWAPGEAAGQGFGFRSNAEVYLNASLVATYTAFTSGSVAMVAFDPASGKVWLGKDGTWFNSGDPAAGTGNVTTVTGSEWQLFVGGVAISLSAYTVQFGQNGFTHTAPTGFAAPNSGSLPNVVDDLGGVENPEQHFAAIARLGDATADASSLDYLKNLAMVWIKNRDQTDEWKEVDLVRGVTKELNFDSTNAESTDANGVTAIASSSYTLGTGAGGYNDNAENFMDYLFDGNGAGVSNTDGSITSTVSISPGGAWSFGTFTGTGASATVGHGLAGAPEFYIVKNAIDITAWLAGHIDIGGDQFLEPMSTSTPTTNADKFSSHASATVLNIGTSNEVNGSGDAMFFMAFRSVPGICKVGSYEGNGNVDGTFVGGLGFSPAFFLTKSIDSTSEWMLYNDKSPAYGNVKGGRMQLDSTLIENVATALDFTSTGVKMRLVADPNVAETYVYLAIAKSSIGGGIPFPNAV